MRWWKRAAGRRDAKKCVKRRKAEILFWKRRMDELTSCVHFLIILCFSIFDAHSYIGFSHHCMIGRRHLTKNNVIL